MSQYYKRTYICFLSVDVSAKYYDQIKFPYYKIKPKSDFVLAVCV